jgi:DNA-binding CsgD family transcriptional regulator
MKHIDPEALTPVASRFLDRTRLTPAEYSEVLRMAQGFACKDSANAANVSPETIRARRKRIYRKLDLTGVAEVISGLLAVSLEMLAGRERLGPRGSAESGTGTPALGPVTIDRNTAVPSNLPGSGLDLPEAGPRGAST